MRLNQDQQKHFDREGYVFIENLFSPQEIKVLTDEVPGIYAQHRPEIVREKDGSTPRTSFAAHTYNEAFRRLGSHPRLIEPVMQLLGGDVYMHQFKINAKAAFNGDVWQWHQDYGTWSRDDKMPESRAMNIALFLADVTEFNGALMFIPRSHKKGVVGAGHDLQTTSYPLWTLDDDTVRELVAEGGMVAPKGPAGSMLLFHGNLVHASPGNLSPHDRWIVYLSLNRTDNSIQQFKRPEYIAHRDFNPIVPLNDECLLELAQSQTAAE